MRWFGESVGARRSGRGWRPSKRAQVVCRSGTPTSGKAPFRVPSRQHRTSDALTSYPPPAINRCRRPVMNNISRSWPSDAEGRVPYWVYSDPEIYAAELERIWYGPHWLYCALEAEIPLVGDFKTTTLGERPVVVVRSGPDEVSVLENRCAHRGVKFCQARKGPREGSALSLPPVELQPARRPARCCVPPRRSRPGRHARRLRPEEPQPEQAACRGGERRGLGHLLGRYAVVPGVSGGTFLAALHPRL